jgi:hypothetical protein
VRRLPPLRQFPFNVLEPPRERVDGAPQGVLWVDAKEACIVDEREEQVSEFLFAPDVLSFA